MKRLLAALLLVSILCTSAAPMHTHGAEDPCGKGCPLIEKFTIPLDEQQTIVVYSYSCGSRGETYVKNTMVSYSVYNYEEDVIRQFTRQNDGHYELNIIPKPTRKVIAEKPANSVSNSVGNDGYNKVKTGGSCAYAPNYKCDLYVKPFSGEKEIYETIALDIIGKTAYDAYVVYLSEQFAALLIPNKAWVIGAIVAAEKAINALFVDQHRLTYQAYDTVDMCRGVVEGTCVQETIYKKEQHRTYYTDNGVYIDDIISTIGQYDKEEEFMSYCIGRYHNEYHSPNHTYLYECSKVCKECGGGNRNASHEYLVATCTLAKRCKWCGITDGEALGHFYNSASCDAPKTCFRCKVTSGSPLGHNYSAATCMSAKKCTRCGVTSGSALGHNYSAATCTSAKKCTRCGATSGSALGHSYSAATCTSAKKCTRCGATSGSVLGHSYSAATCTSAKKCTRCGITSGSALGHSYSEATCTSAKKCTRCGATSGSALGHSYSAATCTSAKKCTRCGITSGLALGHNYSSWSFFDKSYHIRTCSRCKISQKALHKIETLGCKTCGWKGETAIARKINSILAEEIIIGE